MNTVIYKDIKFGLKPSGYYQSTVEVDGRRLWLHQYKYECEVGKLIDGYEVHHADHNKLNNDISNLVLMTAQQHRNEHYAENIRYLKSEKQLNHLASIRPLAAKAKRGEYVGKKHIKKNLDRICEFCDKEFTMHTRARNDTKFCSNKCRDMSHKSMNFSEKECAICGNVFKQKAWNATCCSPECSKESYRLKRVGKKVSI